MCKVGCGVIETEETAQLALGATALHGSVEAGGNGWHHSTKHLDQQDSHHLVGLFENLQETEKQGES